MSDDLHTVHVNHFLSAVLVCADPLGSAGFFKAEPAGRLSGVSCVVVDVAPVTPLPPVIFLQRVCSCNNRPIPNKVDSVRSWLG